MLSVSSLKLTVLPFVGGGVLFSVYPSPLLKVGDEIILLMELALGV